MEKPFSAYKGTEPYVFVCYAHRDSDIVYKDMASLKERGVNVWYDEGIPGGASWRAQIAEALSGASCLLFFISRSSLESGHCTREIRFALDHEIDVLPVYLENCELPAEFALALGGVQALHRDKDTFYEQHLEEASRGKFGGAPVARPLARKNPPFSVFRIGLLAIALFIGVAVFYAKPGGDKEPGYSAHPHAFAPYLEGLDLFDRWDQQGNLDDAIAKFRESLSLDPNFPLAWARLAEALRIKSALTGDEELLNAAFEAAEEAASFNDSLSPVQLALGRMHLAKGNIDLAHAALQRARELDANDAAVHIGLGNVYTRMGRLAEADASYRKAIALSPRKANYHDAYANFLTDQERYDEAINHFQSAIAMAPDYYPAYVNLGAILDSTGRLPEAIAMYEQAAEIRPTYMGFVNLGHAYTDTNQLEKAEASTRKALEINDSDWLAWGNLGFIYWAKGQELESEDAFNTAISLASKALEASPRDPLIYSDLGVYHAKLGRAHEAVLNAEKAMSLQPDSAYILAMAAETYESIGHRGEAMELLAAAMEEGYSINQIIRNRDLSKVLGALNELGVAD